MRIIPAVGFLAWGLRGTQSGRHFNSRLDWNRRKTAVTLQNASHKVPRANNLGKSITSHRLGLVWSGTLARKF